MTNRREFLQSAAVLSAAPLAGRAAFASDRPTPVLEAVVTDVRHRAARDFATRAGGLGVMLHPIEGDITSVWTKFLATRWQAGHGAVAGLTERPALFLLERLAWDSKLRVVFEAEHAPDGARGATHRVIRSNDPSLGARLADAAELWPHVLADALVAGTSVCAHDFRPTGAAMAAHLNEPEKLYSWIIAPRDATTRGA